MATNFPTSVDNFTNPTANDSLNLPSHSTQHANANDAIEAIEGYLLTAPMGLRLIKSQTIGSGVTSVTVSNAFSAEYENYKIIISGGTGAAATDIYFQLGTATTNYVYGLIAVTYSSGSVTTGTSSTQANTSQIAYAGYHFATKGASMNCDVIRPFLATPTVISAPVTYSTFAGTVSGMQLSDTSFTDFKIGVNVSSMTGGTIYVYGYTKA